MVDLIAQFKSHVADGLARKSVVQPSKWAQKYRIMGAPEPGLWGFLRRPFLKALHDSRAEVNCIRKAAQLGLTETALNITLFHMDMFRRDCLYVLPSDRDARDFSAGRFSAAIDLSEHIKQMFSDVKNVGHKRAGAANLYIRGGRSTSGLKSIPVGTLMLDELDEMSDRAVSLAFERQSGYDESQRCTWMISTPTIPRFGISNKFDNSTQEWFFFPCPHCGRLITLKWPESFEVCGDNVVDPRVKDSFIKCYECKHKLDHETKPEWLANGSYVEAYSGRPIRGFALNQMFSPTVTPEKFALQYLRGLSDPAAEQEFFNSKCGIPYVVAGGQVTDAMLESCIGSHVSGQFMGNRYRSIGVDVGGHWLHYEVDEWLIQQRAGEDINQCSKVRMVEAGKVKHFEEIDPIVRRLGVHFGVVDANPEKRKAYELATRHRDRFAICYYAGTRNSRQINYNKDESTVKVDRTSWMDLALGRFKFGTIKLPRDVSLEYRGQIKEPARRYKVTEQGDTVGEYLSAGDDHFAHARTYSEIALTTFLPTVAVSHNMEQVI